MAQPPDPAQQRKRQTLRRHGTLNPEPESVTDPLFHGNDFFDPNDLVQVKYEMLRRVRLPFDAVRNVQAFVTEADDVRREVTSRVRALAETLGTSMRPAPTTPFNKKVGPHRRFDWLVMDLNDIKRVRRGLGGSINDVVLTVVTGAVQRYLERHKTNPGQIDFRVMTPVSVRTTAERGALGNRVSAWFLDLPIAEPDPREQLKRIRAQSEHLKESRQAVGAALLQLADGALLYVGLVLIGIGRGAGTPLLMLTLLRSKAIGPSLMGVAGGLFFTAGEIGGVLGPTLTGFLADWTGSYAAGLEALAAVSVGLALLALLLGFELARPSSAPVVVPEA